MVIPLTKKKGKELLVRRPEIQAKLEELEDISVSELFSRSRVSSPENDGFIPNECLMYFVRLSLCQGLDEFDDLFKILSERVLRLLPKATVGNDEYIVNSTIRENAFGRFKELLVIDGGNSPRLDYFEVNFNKAIMALRIDAQRNVLRSVGRGEMSGSNDIDVKLQEGGDGETCQQDQFTVDNFNFDYHFALDEAVNKLPWLQRVILYLESIGIPIYSKHPEVESISKLLGKSEKTIRIHRKKAHSALKKILVGDHQ